MALKLGKCRLCLKLGDFYSIFTMDNNLQLAEMVMECARVKVYEGDGLPDKICSECIQKLSSAHIFKQQCERSDQELRRNYVPPPGVNCKPSSSNRQSSYSAFSNHTDTSTIKKDTPTSSVTKTSPGTRSWKRSLDSNDNASISGRSHDSRYSSIKRVEELRTSEKRPRRSINTPYTDSDYDDRSVSQFSAETDSDELETKGEFNCNICGKEFATKRSVAAHTKVHSRKSKQNHFANIPEPDSSIQNPMDVDDKLTCDKCNRTFKLKIMLKRHREVCGREPHEKQKKELHVSLKPIDSGGHSTNIECEPCTTFETVNKVHNSDKTEHNVENGKLAFPCYYKCGQMFDEYGLYTKHVDNCSKKDNTKNLFFTCPLCLKLTTKKSAYYNHIKHKHNVWRDLNNDNSKLISECRICGKHLASQDQLITHLAAHMSNKEDEEESGVESIVPGYSTPQATQEPLKCKVCDKQFSYRKSLINHELSQHPTTEIEIKPEPLENNTSCSLLSESNRQSESESSQEEGDDRTCDICEKEFYFKRQLLHHKRTKHNMSSGTKRAKIGLKDCSVRCRICDIEMKVCDINEHNLMHKAENVKPRNLYTCAECGEKFENCKSLATHIRLVHRLKQQVLPGTAELADFCEVVVTKTEPLVMDQDDNDLEKAPSLQEPVDLGGFICPLCGKKMRTLKSLKQHVKWHSKDDQKLEKDLECFVCKEKFRFQCHYRVHMRGHYTDTNLDPALLTCGACGRRSKNLRAARVHMNYHKQTRFKTNDYHCSICNRVYQHRKVYLGHMAIHHKRGEGVDTVIGAEPRNNPDAPTADGSNTCHHCGKVCDSEVSLKHHIIWHKSKTSLYGARHECRVCGIKFTNKRRQELHIRTHYEDDNGPYKCPTCGKGFTNELYHRKHIKSHNFNHESHKARIAKLRKDKVKCPICIRFYPDLVKLIRHMRRTHPESKMVKTDPDAPAQNYFSCKLCAKVFLDERRLQYHEEAHLRKPEFFKCKFCSKKTISLKNHRIHIKSHLSQKYTEEPLKCMHCEETFVRGYDLHYHLRDIHGINETWIAECTEKVLKGPLKELQCSICLKVLASKGNFERHLDYHNSLRCNYCFEYFNSLRFLEGHLTFSCEKKKLVGETEVYPKKLKCHNCYKVFHLQVKLDCHLRTQHGIKISKEVIERQRDIVCDYCFKVFENEYALSTHKIYHRTVSYYGCIYCNRKFNTVTMFNRHKNHHFSQLNVDNPTKCEHCDETFVAFREMIRHMKEVHNDDKDWIVMPKESNEEKCHICNKKFYNLHKHLAYHENNKCRKCSEYFFSQIDYDSHLCAIESDEEVDSNNDIVSQPVYTECPFCFKPTTKKNSQKLHNHIHKISSSISCRFCSFKFKTIDAFHIHAFSHRSKKYDKKPIKCRKCGEKFVRYGPFIRHMQTVHKSKQKMHYRTTIKAEPCVVCGGNFPNLHNHYKAHLLNQCRQCHKYFTSSRAFSRHNCDKEDSEPSKVFTSDVNLVALINAYTPTDEKDDQKYYGHTDDEEENNEDQTNVNNTPYTVLDDESQNSTDINMHMMVHTPIISDVLSLYEAKEENPGKVTNLTDENIDGDNVSTVITIDD
ncbi:zinc finger protein 721-like [Battus philenor]|uniref:zinc finger protein 721-like n=1 Tax=Battus philenor TaxID=42288 RepID=UPI0035CFEFC1